MKTCAVPDCDNTINCHVLVRASCCYGAVRVCRSCFGLLLRSRATCHGNRAAHVADHPHEATCWRDDARWTQDGCRIDGAEVIDLAVWRDKAVTS